MNTFTKQRSQRIVALAVTLTLALAAAAMAAPKSERAGKYLTLEGRVLQINKESRTLLVSDMWSKRLYLVNIPEGETFKITFGIRMGISDPDFRDVHNNDRVRMRCTRDEQHLARLDDGGIAIALTVAH